MDGLECILTCIKNIKLQIDLYGDEVVEYKIGENVNCKITDYGIRLEYKNLHYSDLYKVSQVSQYFEIK